MKSECVNEVYTHAVHVIKVDLNYRGQPPARQIMSQKEVIVSRLAGLWYPIFCNISHPAQMQDISAVDDDSIHVKQVFRTLCVDFKRESGDLEGTFYTVDNTCCFCFQLPPNIYRVLETDYDRYLVSLFENGGGKVVFILGRDGNLAEDVELIDRLKGEIQAKCGIKKEQMVSCKK